MNENTGKLYGYIRVSTKEQNEDRQRLAMHEFGIADRELYMDKQSGKDFERPNYKNVSCSPFRVPIARLAAAQAAIKG